MLASRLKMLRSNVIVAGTRWRGPADVPSREVRPQLLPRVMCGFVQRCPG